MYLCSMHSFCAVIAIEPMYRLSNAAQDFDDVYLTELFPEVVKLILVS